MGVGYMAMNLIKSFSRFFEEVGIIRTTMAPIRLTRIQLGRLALAQCWRDALFRTTTIYYSMTESWARTTEFSLSKCAPNEIIRLPEQQASGLAFSRDSFHEPWAAVPPNLLSYSGLSRSICLVPFRSSSAVVRETVGPLAKKLLVRLQSGKKSHCLQECRKSLRPQMQARSLAMSWAPIGNGHDPLRGCQWLRSLGLSCLAISRSCCVPSSSRSCLLLPCGYAGPWQVYLLPCSRGHRRIRR